VGCARSEKRGTRLSAQVKLSVGESEEGPVADLSKSLFQGTGFDWLDQWASAMSSTSLKASGALNRCATSSPSIPGVPTFS
jgi:hypothetical protein